MDKSGLISYIAKRNDITKKEATHCFETTINGIIDAIAEGNDIKLIGFGQFFIKERAGKSLRVPGKDGLMEIPPKRVVRFKAGKMLSDLVAYSDEDEEE